MSKKIVIVNNSISNYKIVYGNDIEAATELQKYLFKTVGIELPLICDCEKAEYEIRVGKTNRTCKSCNYDGIDSEGFVIKVINNNLSIKGNTKRADMYAVYEFLDKYIGWRFIYKDEEYLLEGDVEIPADLCYKFTPDFKYRQLDWICTHYEDWQTKNKDNHEKINWVGFVHTLAGLTGMNDQSTQPCLSDPSVLKTVIASVRKLLDENPDCKIISVSQNDNQNYCKCSKCAAVDAEEGSPAGTLMRFVNAVADDIKDEYPDVAVETLAYQYTRKAPLITKPHDNVIVRLCSIECCFSHSLSNNVCEVNASFKHDIEEWGKICNRLYIWDYVTNFSFYIPPFPNFNILLPNMHFFAENHVTGMYPEGNYQSESGEFGELRAYLLGKTMWNPYMDKSEYDGYMNDFLRGYYGFGWQNIRNFIDFTIVNSEAHHFNIWSKPFDIISESAYRENYETIENWWDEAEKTAGNDINLQRVKKSRLQWTYIKLMLKPNPSEGKIFFDTVNALGIRWNEWYNFKSDPDFTKIPTEWLQ